MGGLKLKLVWSHFLFVRVSCSRQALWRRKRWSCTRTSRPTGSESPQTSRSLPISFQTAATPPSPVIKLTLYAPAGLKIDAHGAGTCSQNTLTLHGPTGCPPDSRAGFGGGVGVVALANTLIHEPYTIDFFFGPASHGHLALLAYASAVAPVPVELVVTAHEVPAPKP